MGRLPARLACIAGAGLAGRNGFSSATIKKKSFLKSEAVVQESTIPCKAEEEDSSMACKKVHVIQRHLRPHGQLQYKKKIQREQNDSNL